MEQHTDLPGGPAPANSRSAIGKVLAVLECLATSTKPMSVGDLAKALSLSRSQAFRIVAMLEQEDMLIRHPVTKRIMFGTRFARVACRLLAGSPLKPLWHIVLNDLAKAVGATCNIVVYEGCVGTYFDRIEENWPHPLRFRFGSKVPLHCTAGGKLYLASLPRNERAIVLEGLHLKAFTDKTITDSTWLAQQLDQIGADQVGFDDGEFVADMVAVAVPVRAANGALLATLALHARNPPWSMSIARDQVPSLAAASRRLAAIFQSHANPIFETKG